MIFKNYSRSIKTKLIVNVILIHALLMGFVIYDMVQREQTFMHKQLQSKGKDLTAILASNAGQYLLNNDIVALGELLADMDTISDHFMVFILDTHFRVKASLPSEYFNQTLNDTISIKLYETLQKIPQKDLQLAHNELIDTLCKITVNGETIGYARTILDAQTLHDELSIVTRQGIAYILLAIILGSLFAYLSVHTMTTNLQRLTNAAKELAKRNFTIELPQVKQKDEIYSMTKAFKVMQNSLKKYIKELDANKERLDLALEGSNDGLWDWDLQSDTVYYSPRWKEMLGYKDEELPNTIETWKNSIAPNQLESALEYLQEFLASSQTYYEQKLNMRCKSGRYLPILARAKKVVDTNNKALRLIGTHVDLSEITEVQEKLRYQAQHDTLTQLPNRSLFLDRLEQAIKQARRYNNKLAVLFLDLDHFKEINDTLGHEAGDALLVKIAKILSDNIRESDTVSRFGGDEFAVIIDKVANEKLIIDIAQKIMQKVNIPHFVEGKEFFNTFSIGVSLYPDDGLDATTLLRNADLAMYKAKHNGKNGYQFYTADMTQKALQRITIETNLRHAIQRDDFEVFYQPQVNSMTNSIVGLEALVRWRELSPSIFIPIAEEIGIISQIDTFVMHEVLAQKKRWEEKGIVVPKLSLNLSVAELINSEYIDTLKEQLHTHQCDPKTIELEITETQIMSDPKRSIELLNMIKALGARISIDDFGTGYSSLAYIKKLPIDRLKIDKSFVDEINDNTDDQEIIKTIISMAQNMHLNITAEGVESQQQVILLQEYGCVEIQGYYYYEPMDKHSIEKLLQQQNKTKETPL